MNAKLSIAFDRRMHRINKGGGTQGPEHKNRTDTFLHAAWPWTALFCCTGLAYAWVVLLRDALTLEEAAKYALPWFVVGLFIGAMSGVQALRADGRRDF